MSAGSDSSGSQGDNGGGLFGWLRNLGRADSDADLRESIREVIAEHHDGEDMAPEQQEMLLNLVSFGELQADDVMVPRPDIVAISLELDLTDTIAAFVEAKHSRLPVYRQNLDDVAGFAHIKDVLAHLDGEEDFSLEAIKREILVVPPSMPVLDLLARMRATRIHMAVVVDEYGGTDGLVTIEDVVEEIVGEIEDEHDTPEDPLLVALEDGMFEVDGRAYVDTLEEQLGVDLAPNEIDEEIDTVGGLVTNWLGRVPRLGETFEHDSGLVFEVTDADPRRVRRLRVHPARGPAADAAD